MSCCHGGTCTIALVYGLVSVATDIIAQSRLCLAPRERSAATPVVSPVVLELFLLLIFGHFVVDDQQAAVYQSKMPDPRVVVISDSDQRRVVSFSEQSAAGYSDDREDDDSQEVVISSKGSLCELATEEEEPSRPGIGQVSTFDSSSAAEDYDKLFTRNVRQATDEAKSRRRWSLNSSLRSARRTEVLDRLSDALKEASHHDDHFDFSLFGSWEDLVSQVFYISMFSVFGTVLRVYMGRIFGLDCQLKMEGNGPHDFLTPFSSRICITSDGKSQPGSLFIDLPANILGS